MASDNYGYRSGRRDLRSYPVAAASAAIVEGDMLTIDANGFASQASAGDNRLLGFAAEGCASPASDGDTSILVDVSRESVFYVAGSTAVTQSDLGKVCDISDARTADLAASVDDVLFIRDIDITNQAVYVSIHVVPVAAVAGV